MPEEIEIDTDKLRETIDDEIEKSGGRMLRVTGAVASSAASAYAANNRAVPDSLLALTSRYTKEQSDIQSGARKLEQERDTKVAEAARLLAEHHHYACAVALLQVAIALAPWPP